MLARGAHARGVDEFFRMMIDLPSAAPTIRVNVKRASLDRRSRWRRQADFIFHRLVVIGELQIGAIDAVKFPNHSQEICLPAKQSSHDDSRALAQPRPAKMLPGEDALGFDE